MTRRNFITNSAITIALMPVVSKLPAEVHLEFRPDETGYSVWYHGKQIGRIWNISFLRCCRCVIKNEYIAIPNPKGSGDWMKNYTVWAEDSFRPKGSPSEKTDQECFDWFKEKLNLI